MAQPGYASALRHVHTLFDFGTIGGLTDGQFLERFTFCDDEAAEVAFGALVERHGPMVLRICRSVLRERHDAEDALQATFLVLASKAASIRNQNSVASWLHGVAFRVASCEKLAAVRQRGHQRKVAHGALVAADRDDRREEIGSILHEEIDRLPEKSGHDRTLLFQVPLARASREAARLAGRHGHEAALHAVGSSFAADLCDGG